MESSKNKTLTIIASDHASFSYKEKLKEKKFLMRLPVSWSRINVPLMLMLFKKRNPERSNKLMCINPAKRFNIYPKKGIIKKDRC